MNIHTAASESLQIQGEIGKVQLLEPADDFLPLLQKQRKLFRVCFNSGNVLVNPDAHIVKSLTL